MEPYQLYNLFGHPGGMVAHASKLRYAAEDIEARAKKLARRVDLVIFEGPAAERFRDRAAEGRERAAKAAAGALEAAEWFESQARIADRRIDAYLAEQERIARKERNS
ncbi:MAG: hypothetical protein KY391_06890 [Actinobacteria bacterium]|nr:hypothetical protein [Actinomycetota bacterium]